MGEYFQLLRRDLTRPLPSPQWPAGIRLDHYRDELAPAIHAVLRLAQDQGGGRVGGLDRWRQQFVTDAEFDPTLCLVASDANGILGVAQCWTSAFIKNLAIHPAAQGQGLGRALLLHTFQMFQQRNEAFIDLKVRESNLRARQLYESAGMVFVLRDLVPEE
ncbi:GNAT family N-acetyltransferase [Pseudomonas sp. ADAK18]|uniref:GNAT family N-acetyltransferase n=1 Tax=Pseudomonas sp. ADAK18 TaxID=2730848 RepID=UPI0014646FF9|nr:GNAT family N-acetyltransferase [Pseudomonas sp. ADAK18]QJI30910.1 GNAT family N-acetyltransferase [Pseudomonas sp. ADAK18]